MNRHLFSLVMLGLFLVSPMAQAGKELREDRIVDMPVVETEDLVGQWLELRGFHYTRSSQNGMTIWLTAEKNSTQLTIVLKPRSPLATHVTLSSQSHKTPRLAGDLTRYLVGYMDRPDKGHGPPQKVAPDIVQRMRDSTVCLYADNNGGDFQFSGFVIDAQGLIVSTAHDLSLNQKVSVFLHNGRRLTGVVTRMDPARDLTLISVDEPLETAVSVRNGRFLLQNGDPLFALTCPAKRREGLQTGFVDGPPRSVNGFPLWQVQMHIEPGSSGSPVFDSQARLAAVVKGRFRGTDSIGFLIPFETVLHFLEKY